MAFDAYLDLDGIDGESTRKGFEKKIELLSFNMGAHNASSMASGGGGGSGRASLSPFSITKLSDAASPLIFESCCSGKHFPKATITLHKAGGEAAVDYLVYTFEEVFIQSYDCSGAAHGEDRPMEQISFAYGRVEVTFTPQEKTGAKGSPVVGSWDQLAVSR